MPFVASATRSCARCGHLTGLLSVSGNTSARRARARAFEATKAEQYDGVYGQWSIDDHDIKEVLAYRGGITCAAICTALVALNGTTSLISLPDAAVNGACVIGGAGFGVSLVLVHMYVGFIKRTIQALFAAGVAGSAWLMASQNEDVVQYVAHHPGAVLLVGPAFAAVTGIAVKEGLCYGKLEAALLALVTPAWLLAHMFGPPPSSVDNGLALAYAAIFAVFAAGKYSQSIKDDIGDKSIFKFLALPPEKQAELESQRRPSQ